MRIGRQQTKEVEDSPPNPSCSINIVPGHLLKDYESWPGTSGCAGTEGLVWDPSTSTLRDKKRAGPKLMTFGQRVSAGLETKPPPSPLLSLPLLWGFVSILALRATSLGR